MRSVGRAPRVTVVGDALLDRDWSGSASRLCPDSAAPVVDLADEEVRPGGAALTALAAVSQGCEVTMVTAIARDDAGRIVRDCLADAGVHVVDLGLDGTTPEKIRVRTAGFTVVRLDRGCDPSEPGSWTVEADDAVRRSDATLLSDYGRGMVHRVPRRATTSGPPVVWDPHPRSRHPDVDLTLATPNLDEASVLASHGGEPHEVAASLAVGWGHAVAVTCGSRGVVVHDTTAARLVPTEPVAGDPCGAGDWFAAGTAAALARGAELTDAVSAGCSSARRWIAGEHTCVATSGCFDVLHVGHLAMLEHAASLGDRLVVLVNSDDSVRRLKGRNRPVNSQEDRAALLRSIACVDEVRIFDDLTPCRALESLRPDVFVKGGDYRVEDLPETRVLAGWGGHVAIAPLVADRSTTRVLQIAQRLVG